MSGAPIPPRPIRILVFGAGVIGSLYAAKLAAAGNQVTLFARGRRLAELQDAGLRWLVAGAEQVADVEITGELGGGPFDMILVAVRYEQADEALQAVAAAQFSPDVPMVGTMINAPAPYEQWSSILGPVRLVAAFPGAGGSIEHGLLDADFTAESVQITTIGEPAGGLSRRVQRLATVFRGAGIATEISTEMRAWQLCHLALVVPLGDAVFRADAAGWPPQRAGRSCCRRRASCGPDSNRCRPWVCHRPRPRRAYSAARHPLRSRWSCISSSLRPSASATSCGIPAMPGPRWPR